MNATEIKSINAYVEMGLPIQEPNAKLMVAKDVKVVIQVSSMLRKYTVMNAGS